MSDAVIVNVEQGALRGRRATTKSGGSYFSFQGIPYAQPPVGRLRFKAPQPPEPWTGTRDALTEGNVCPQIHEFTNGFVGDEDCLFVNVYTPQLPVSGQQEGDIRLAVMVYIHGGGFTTGWGNADVYGPDYLLDEGVLVVTFNYRLGTFGFLSTEDGEIPGNAGMKDQVAALRWVQQNIARFGGDPNNVTIFGESAGGASVHYHMLSPMSKGLFNRAISQSGSALNCWAFSRHARNRTINLAKALGCKSEASKDIHAFFKDLSAKQMVDSLRIGMTEQELRRGHWYPFVPSSEKDIETSEEKFLPLEPMDIVKSGKFNHVPYITGVNSNEGLILLRDLNARPDVIIPMIDKDFQRLLPEDIFPEIDTDLSRKTGEKLKQFYFGDKSFTKDTILQYCQLNSDYLFVHKIIETVKLQLAHSPPPIYIYQLTFEGLLGMWKQHCGAANYPGVCHADDLGYLFNISLANVDLPADAPEHKIRSMIVKMWSNFAKTGNPSLSVAWDPATQDKMCYLKIDLEPKMLENLEQRRIQFWDDLYKQSKCHCK